MADKQVTVGYWGVAGLAQQIRYLLAYSEVEFKDETYTDQDKWFKNDKQSLGIPFPNLPYLIDGDFKLTESSAIVKYVAKKYGKEELLGKTIEDQARVDQFLSVISEVNSAFSGALRTEGWQDKKAETFEKVKAKLVDLENNAKENYALGYLTVVDFRLADFIYVISFVFPEETKEFKNLFSISKTVYEIPQIKKYLATGVTAVFPPFIPLDLKLPGGK